MALQATVSQSHPKFSGSGRQCVANALASIKKSISLEPGKWTTSTMDEILSEGDSIYCSLSKVCKSQYLSTDDIPKSFGTLASPLHGTVHGETDCPFYGLEDGISMSTKDIDSCGCIFTMGHSFPSYASAILKHSGSYYFFDPHSRNNVGMVCADGLATMTQHRSIFELALFIRHLAASLNQKGDGIPYEITRFSPFQTFKCEYSPEQDSDNMSVFSGFSAMSEGEYACRLYLSENIEVSDISSCSVSSIELSDISSCSVSSDGSICSIDIEQLNNSDVFLSHINMDSFDLLNNEALKSEASIQGENNYVENISVAEGIAYDFNSENSSLSNWEDDDDKDYVCDSNENDSDTDDDYDVDNDDEKYDLFDDEYDIPLSQLKFFSSVGNKGTKRKAKRSETVCKKHNRVGSDGNDLDSGRTEGSSLDSSRTEGNGLNRSGTRVSGMDSGRTEGSGLDSGRIEGSCLDSGRTEGSGLDRGRIEGSGLDRGRIEGSCLDSGRIEGSGLDSGRIEGSCLDGGRIEGSCLDGGRIEGSCLDSGRIEGSGLDRGRIEGSGLDSGRIEGSCLDSGRIEGSCLDCGRIEGSGLDRCRIEGSGLDSGRIEGSCLDSGRIEGSCLDSGRIEGSGLDSGRTEGRGLDSGGTGGSGLDSGRTEGSGLDSGETEGSDVSNDKRCARKRSRNESEWKCNVRKRQKNHGEEYTAKSGRVVHSRKIGKGCGEVCKFKCHQNISEQKRQEIFDSYWSLGDITLQRNFLIKFAKSKKKSTSSKTDSRRANSILWNLPSSNGNIRVCKTFFLQTLDISDQMVITANAKASDITMSKGEGRGRHGKHSHVINAEQYSFVRQHISSFPAVESHYCRQNTRKMYLAAGLNVAKMFELYKCLCRTEGKAPVHLHSYRKIFNNEFNLAFHKPIKDMCDFCSAFKKGCESYRESMKEKMELHIQNKNIARENKARDKQASKKSNDVTAACFDLQEVLATPKSNESILYYKRKLCTYNLSIYNLGTSDAFCYIWNETIAKRGSSEISSCVFDFIKKSNSSGKTKFKFYSDNCGGQNKNRQYISMLWYCFQKFSIQSVEHSYLEKGHTQNEGDSVHATIEYSSRNTPVYTTGQWAAVVRTARRAGNGARSFF